MRTEFKAALVVLLAGGAAARGASFLPATALSSAELVERGRYLVKIAGCNDCTRRAMRLRAATSPRSSG